MEHLSHSSSSSWDDGEITVGPWGGSGGKEFAWKAEHGITQIIIIHTDEVVDSIMFKTQNHDGSITEYSNRFGGESGNGGTRTDKVNIDYPSEFLTGVSGVTNPMPNDPYIVLRSIRFYTNRTEYGPFGRGTGKPFWFCPKGSVITGFFGRSGFYIDAIGVYIKPLSSVFVTVPLMEENSPGIMQAKIVMSRSALLPRSPGPWGGEDGRHFDDGVSAEIKQVLVYPSANNIAISGVQFKYLKKNGDVRWSPMHGSTGGDLVKKIEVDCENEFFTGIEGFYGPIEGSGGMNVIRSLTFHTNKGKYGPLGRESANFSLQSFAVPRL